MRQRNGLGPSWVAPENKLFLTRGRTVSNAATGLHIIFQFARKIAKVEGKFKTTAQALGNSKDSRHLSAC
jgi:hypothetical protein